MAQRPRTLKDVRLSHTYAYTSSAFSHVALHARVGSACGAERLGIVIQKTRQLRMQNSEIRLVRRCAVLSFDASAF